MSVAVALPGLRQRTPEWVLERRRHLGSSDAPVLAGETGSLYRLWAEKTGRLERDFGDDEAELMQIGALLEPALRDLYVARTNRPIRARNVTLVRKDWRVAAASLDAESGPRVVETKWTHSAEWHAAVAAGSTDPVPGRVMAQVQWQLYVTGRDVADVAVLLGRKFHVIEVGRDDRMIGDLEYIARDFWPYVEHDEPPGIDGSDATEEALRAVYPADNGAWLPPTPELVAIVRDWRAAVALRDETADAAKELGNGLRALLGEASGITGLVSYRNNQPTREVDWPAVADALARDLAAELHSDSPDALLSRYVEAGSSMKPGPRVLRVLKGGKAL